jgi:tetratricopeptide (TPR) repeat protein
MLNKINTSPQKQILIVYIVLTVVTVAVFWQVNQFDFVNIDDNMYVTQNSHVQSGITLDGLRWAFGTKYFDLWHPLVWLSFMLDYQLHGLNAGGYHLTNLILHILSALLLFWLFNRMTGMIWRSAFVAALFALHPLHVESVAWIAERKDVLSAFFWMLTLCLYVYYTEKPVIKRYLLVLFSFVCALLSKPMVVTLPVIMILLDYWPLKRFESQKGNLFLWQLREKISFFILSTVLIIVTLYAPINSPSKILPFSDRIANAPVAFVTYLEKTFWPHDLAVFYPFPAQIPVWQVLFSSLLILGISAAVIVAVKRLPHLFFGWMWYSITIAPVIGIIQIGCYAIADRYYYLPSIGIAVMLAWGIPSFLKRAEIREIVLFTAGIIFLAIIAFLSWEQCGYWKNSIELFKHTLQVTKNNYPAYINLASALAEKGKTGEAMNYYNKAIYISPKYAELYYNRGNLYEKQGNYQRAIEDFNSAAKLKPDYAAVYYNRGVAYNYLGQYQRAIEDYNKALSITPDDSDNYNNRGAAYVKLGQYQRAIEDFNKAITLKQNYTDAYNNRANVYFYQGNTQLGCLDARKTCELGHCKTLEAAKGKGYCR